MGTGTEGVRVWVGTARERTEASNPGLGEKILKIPPRPKTIWCAECWRHIPETQQLQF